MFTLKMLISAKVLRFLVSIFGGVEHRRLIWAAWQE